jgi:predicted nucleotidyltransferase
VDFEPYRAARRSRFQQQKLAARAESQRARTVAESLARVLVEGYGATRVLLVGSLARGEFGQGSDIDLAAAGVPPESFFAAGAELERLAQGFKIDLVPLESANPFFLDQVAQDGIALV